MNEDLSYLRELTPEAWAIVEEARRRLETRKTLTPGNEYWSGEHGG